MYAFAEAFINEVDKLFLDSLQNKYHFHINMIVCGTVYPKCFSCIFYFSA